MQLLLLLVVALTITVALIPPLANAAGRLRLLDRPGERKVHAAPIPRVGGLAIGAGTLFPLWIMAAQPGEWTAIYCGVGDTAGHGRARRPLRARLALEARRAGARLRAGGHCRWRVHRIHHAHRSHRAAGGTVARPELRVPGGRDQCHQSLRWTGRARRRHDAAGGARHRLDQHFSPAIVAVASTTAALAGALLGFLRFNTHPARVFMGDSGSQVLGFLAGVLAIKATQGADVTVSAALPLLLLAWPILDTLTVMIERIRAGRSPFAADRRHFHHRLLALGFDHYQSVLIIYAVQCGVFLLAYVLRFESDLVIIAAFAVFATVVIGLLERAKACAWRWAGPAREPSELALQVRWLRENDRLAARLPRTAADAARRLMRPASRSDSTASAPMSRGSRRSLVLAQLVVLIIGNRPRKRAAAAAGVVRCRGDAGVSRSAGARPACAAIRMAGCAVCLAWARWYWFAFAPAASAASHSRRSMRWCCSWP